MGARSKFAIEPAADFSNVDADRPCERAAFGDANDAAVHRRFDAAFDDQRIAIQDFRAFELDFGPDDEAAARSIARILGGLVGARKGGRSGCPSSHAARSDIAPHRGCLGRSVGTVDRPRRLGTCEIARPDTRSTRGLWIGSFREHWGFAEHDLSWSEFASDDQGRECKIQAMRIYSFIFIFLEI
ncbi:hypothetical protein ebA958 [Aromatoleum aromaticum EbN1]|uniref:Uncharacterized protein n=1 Tax=Aromatoleum aromaticum (strain DSM 19018 / LMG 30748 / EbN1) TaxID=76114 RepID=Q5P7S9_AROAE|nr:hypothetical protein ebA958 [Aromatoleum aromaticum EbN1]